MNNNTFIVDNHMNPATSRQYIEIFELNSRKRERDYVGKKSCYPILLSLAGQSFAGVKCITAFFILHLILLTTMPALAANKAVAPEPRSGQNTSYATGDDGALQRGVAWPTPRFKDNSDGTVTDNLTGLIWLKDSNCTTFFNGDGTGQNNRTWYNALAAAYALANGSCGLSDSSEEGDWHLPSVNELESLITLQSINPALPTDHPFTGMQSAYYWSSSTYAADTLGAWLVGLGDGFIGVRDKTDVGDVWPVRGGQ